MRLKVQASLLLTASLLTGAAGAASAESGAAARGDTLRVAQLTAIGSSGLHDGSAPLGGRVVMTDWNPSGMAGVASRNAGDLYQAAAGSLGDAGRASSRSARSLAGAESLAKVELGTTQWLALTVVVGLLGAARRRPAR